MGLDLGLTPITSGYLTPIFFLPTFTIDRIPGTGDFVSITSDVRSCGY